MKIGIFGTGAYAFSLANTINRDINRVVMWTPFEDERKNILCNHIIKGLSGVDVIDNVEVTTSLNEVINDSKLLVVAIPSFAVDNLFNSIKDIVSIDTHICIVSKGMDDKHGLFMHEVYEKYFNNNKLAILSGPSFAIDLVSKKMCGLMVASENNETLNIVTDIFSSSYTKIRTTNDIIGTEICGTLKNVMAIVSGMLDGLKASDSTKATFMTAALNEVRNIIIKFNGDSNTVLNYSGVGDLILTCGCNKSRNYTFGKLIGEGKTKDELNLYLKSNTVEGYDTLFTINKLLNSKNIDTTIIKFMYNIVINGYCLDRVNESLMEIL